MPLIILFSLLIATIFWLDSLPVYRVLYIVLNLLILIIFFVSLEVQTSYFPQLPWHQPDGIAPVVITYLAVWLSAFGIIQYALSRQMNIPRTLVYLPFVGAAVLCLNVILPQGLSPAVKLFGSIATVFFMATQLIVFALNFKDKPK